MVAEHEVNRFSDLFGQLGVLGQPVRACGEVACDDHDFAGRLVDVLIELVPRPMAAKFQMEIGEPGKALYLVRRPCFHECLGLSIIISPDSSDLICDMGVPPVMLAEARAERRWPSVPRRVTSPKDSAACARMNRCSSDLTKRSFLVTQLTPGQGSHSSCASFSPRKTGKRQNQNELSRARNHLTRKGFPPLL